MARIKFIDLLLCYYRKFPRKKGKEVHRFVVLYRKFPRKKGIEVISSLIIVFGRHDAVL